MLAANQPTPQVSTNKVETIYFRSEPQKDNISGLPYEDYTGMSNDEFMAGREPLYTRERQEELIDQLYYYFTRAIRAGVDCGFNRDGISMYISTPESNMHIMLYPIGGTGQKFNPEQWYKTNIEKLESLIGYFKVATI